MRTQEQLNAVIAKTKELMEAPSCYSGLKETAGAWLDSIGTDKEKDAAKTFVDAMDECVTPIDGLIAFAESDAGKNYFGDETANKIAAHGREIKAAGAKNCDCAACTACDALLAQKDIIL